MAFALGLAQSVRQETYDYKSGQMKPMEKQPVVQKEAKKESNKENIFERAAEAVKRIFGNK